MNKDIRDFMFRGLMFEAEASEFQRAGIQIGAVDGDAEHRLLEEGLAPFGVSRRNNALEMARLYAILHCFENEIRLFIHERLEEKEGVDWQDKLPPKVLAFSQSRRDAAICTFCGLKFHLRPLGIGQNTASEKPHLCREEIQKTRQTPPRIPTAPNPKN